jgi:quinol monooxygenase YgiN
MAFHSYIVAAGFHTRADAIEAMKQVVAEVTAPSLGEEGCQIYDWSQGADDPTLFLLYLEWRDKACFEAHIATSHVKHAEDRPRSCRAVTDVENSLFFIGLWLHYARKAIV